MSQTKRRTGEFNKIAEFDLQLEFGVADRLQLGDDLVQPESRELVAAISDEDR